MFLIGNDGSTFKRLIHGPEEGYNNVARWNYFLAPEMFGAPKYGSYDVGTWGELQRVVNGEKFQNGKPVVGLTSINLAA
jgi:pyruvate decarboxylase